MASENVQIVDIGAGPFDNPEKCDQIKTAFLQNLAARGIDTIIRYYSDKNNLPCKNITSFEREVLHDHGFNLGVVYQYDGSRPGRYTKETGKKDAAFCLRRASEINQPEGSAVYFGIDADAGTHDPEGVIRYLDEVNKSFDGRFQVGCYAAGTICKLALEKDLVTLTWVPEAPAWSGTQAFMNSKQWTFYQNKTNMKKSGLTGHEMTIDTDIVNPKFNSIGAFSRDGSIIEYKASDVAAIAESRKWVNRLEMPLFEKPHGAPKGHMCVARMVRVLGSAANGWVQVDIDEDGDGDGYCEAKHLSPIETMPTWQPGCNPMKL